MLNGAGMAIWIAGANGSMSCWNPTSYQLVMNPLLIGGISLLNLQIKQCETVHTMGVLCMIVVYGRIAWSAAYPLHYITIFYDFFL